MVQRHSEQKWQLFIEQSESSSLSKLAFCKLNGLNPPTFYAKRKQLTETRMPQAFVTAEVIENTTKYQASHMPAANMVLSVNEIELSIPPSTPTSYTNLTKI